MSWLDIPFGKGIKGSEALILRIVIGFKMLNKLIDETTSYQDTNPTNILQFVRSNCYTSVTYIFDRM